MSIDSSTEQSAASVDEIRSFLGDMKEKSPEAVLGLPTTGELPKLTVIAAVGTALLLLVATGGMFLVNLITGPPAVATPAAPTTNAVSDAASTPATAQAETNEPAAAAGDNVDPDAAIQAMGIGEAKEADPTTNPLENGIDDLLKGLE